MRRTAQDVAAAGGDVEAHEPILLRVLCHRWVVDSEGLHEFGWSTDRLLLCTWWRATVRVVHTAAGGDVEAQEPYCLQCYVTGG